MELILTVLISNMSISGITCSKYFFLIKELKKEWVLMNGFLSELSNLCSNSNLPKLIGGD